MFFGVCFNGSCKNSSICVSGPDCPTSQHVAGTGRCIIHFHIYPEVLTQSFIYIKC